MQSCQNEKMTKRARNPPLFPIEFFKIYFSNFSSDQLTLPPAPSALLLVNNIPNNATLKDHQGKIWHVELEKAENSLAVKDGWQDFVVHHSLSDGDYLIFEYDGNARFNVEIYGKNGLKKGEVLDYYMFDFNVKEEEEKEIAQITSQPPIQKKNAGRLPIQKKNSSRLPVQKKNTSQPISKRGRGRPAKSTKTALATVAKLERAPLGPIKNPFFEITIRRNRCARYSLHIPRSLVITNKLIIPGELKLRDNTGKLWPVKVLPRHDIGGRITSGWVNFYKKHKLKPGDRCIFEFILERKRAGRIVQVHIERKSATTQLVLKGENIADE